MHTKPFDYKRKLCYAWKSKDKKGRDITKKGAPIWHIKTKDIIDDHDFTVELLRVLNGRGI